MMWIGNHENWKVGMEDMQGKPRLIISDGKASHAVDRLETVQGLADDIRLVAEIMSKVKQNGGE